MAGEAGRDTDNAGEVVGLPGIEVKWWCVLPRRAGGAGSGRQVPEAAGQAGISQVARWQVVCRPNRKTQEPGNVDPDPGR